MEKRSLNQERLRTTGSNKCDRILYFLHPLLCSSAECLSKTGTERVAFPKHLATEPLFYRVFLGPF